MNLHLVDQIVLGVYFLAMLAVGYYFSKGNQSTEKYFLGGRNFSGWVIGLSLVGTSISSITFLAYPGDAFKTNWLRFLPNLMLPLAVIVAAIWFLPRLRRGNSVTAYEFLETRFGPSIRGYGAIAFLVAQLARVSMILYLISLVVGTITGLPAHYCVILAGLFVAAYTYLGGIEAVVWTDVIQTVVLLAGGLMCIAVIIIELPGGLTTIMETAIREDKLIFGAPWSISLSEKTATMMLLIGLISWLTEYSSNQNTVQRFCASKSESEAKSAMYICASVSVPTWAFFMFLGTALWVYFQHFPAELPSAILSGQAKAEEILPYFVSTHLPLGLAGLVIAAAIAAAMSSLDSSINAIATVSTHDIYRRFVRPSLSDYSYLQFAKITTLLTSYLMILGALYLIEASTTTLQDTATVVTALLAGGLLTIYLIGFFAKRCSAIHIGLGIAATMLYTLWTIGSTNGVTYYPFDLYYTGLIGNTVMFVVAYGSSYLIHPRPTR